MTDMKPLVVGVLVLAGCTSLRPSTEFDASVDFATFETFTWIDEQPLIRTETQRPLSPLVEQRIMETARSELSQRGLRFVEAPQEADLALAFTVGSRQGLRVTHYPTTNWNRPWHGGWRTGMVRTTEYTEGQLAIDVFDARSGRAVWHGTVSRRVTRGERAEPSEALQEAVAAILEQFPPQ